MRRKLFTLASALSLVLLVATTVLWVRSYWVTDGYLASAFEVQMEGDELVITWHRPRLESRAGAQLPHPSAPPAEVPTTSPSAGAAPSDSATSRPATTGRSQAATRQTGGRYLGVTVADNPATGPLGQVSGVRVSQIQDGSPASRSQLKVGDIIHAVNGQPITAHAELLDAISACSPGQRITLDVVRRGPDGEPKHSTVEVRLDKRPDGMSEPLLVLRSTPEQVAARMTRHGYNLTSTTGDIRVKGSELWTKTDDQLTLYYVEGKVQYTVGMPRLVR